MKMKLGEVAGYLKGLYKHKMSEKKLPVKISYAVMKNQKMLESEYKNLEQQRVKLCEVYAEKDEDHKPIIKDGSYIFSKEDRDAFSEEYKDMMGEEIEVNIHSVSIKELDKCDESDRYDAITPADLEVIAFMLKE